MSRRLLHLTFFLNSSVNVKVYLCHSGLPILTTTICLPTGGYVTSLTPNPGSPPPPHPHLVLFFLPQSSPQTALVWTSITADLIQPIIQICIGFLPRRLSRFSPITLCKSWPGSLRSARWLVGFHEPFSSFDYATRSSCRSPLISGPTQRNRFHHSGSF